MSAIDMAANLESVASASLQAMMPNEVHDARLNTQYGPDIVDGLGAPRLVVKGTLPSGMEWEVPLDLDMKAIYYAEEGAWLASTELARELQKAAQSFRAMVALDASSINSLPLPKPLTPFKIAERFDTHRNVAATLSAWIPAGTERLRTVLRGIDNQIIRSEIETPIPTMNGGRVDYEFEGLQPGMQYQLEKLKVLCRDGIRASSHVTNVRFRTSTIRQWSKQEPPDWKRLRSSDRAYDIDMNSLKRYAGAGRSFLSEE